MNILKLAAMRKQAKGKGGKKAGNVYHQYSQQAARYKPQTILEELDLLGHEKIMTELKETGQAAFENFSHNSKVDLKRLDATLASEALKAKIDNIADVLKTKTDEAEKVFTRTTETAKNIASRLRKNHLQDKGIEGLAWTANKGADALSGGASRVERAINNFGDAVWDHGGTAIKGTPGLVSDIYSGVSNAADKAIHGAVGAYDAARSPGSFVNKIRRENAMRNISSLTSGKNFDMKALRSHMETLKDLRKSNADDAVKGLSKTILGGRKIGLTGTLGLTAGALGLASYLSENPPETSFGKNMLAGGAATGAGVAAARALSYLKKGHGILGALGMAGALGLGTLAANTLSSGGDKLPLPSSPDSALARLAAIRKRKELAMNTPDESIY